jgi:uncharacterized delta-60 repeat protein/CSLREA domain-containing protein
MKPKIYLTTTRLFVAALLLCFSMTLQTQAAPGDLDPSFGNGGKVTSTDFGGSAIAIQSDGKVVAVGVFFPPAGAFEFSLARYNTDGSLDATFGSGGKVITAIGNLGYGFATAVAIQPDGKIIAGGSNNFYGDGTYNFLLARYNTDGSLDSTFGVGGKVVTPFANEAVFSKIAIQLDSKIVAAGTSGGYYDSPSFLLARYNVNGSLDTTFGSGGIVANAVGNYSNAYAVAIQSDGKIVAAGNFDSSNGGFGRFAMIRYQGRAEANFTVTRSDDRNNATCVTGDCSLREAVNAANASGSDDTINFASGLTTVTLTNEIVINNAGALTINGLGANNLTIDGGAGTNRIFYANNATVTISGITLTGGNGTGAFASGNGGAIFTGGGSLTLDGVHITGNTATSFGNVGGGVHYFGGIHRITNSTISANTADAGGGGIYNFSSLIIVNSTISGNTGYNGGGIYDEGGAITLRNVTITNNTNGGINASFATINFGNSIVAGNTNTVTPGYAPEFNCYCIITSAGGNLVGDSPGDSTSTGTVSIAYQPTDIRDTNPRFGALQNNGGSTPTHALLAGSPIIDRGLNALVSPLAPAFDQRGTGFARIRDGNGDGTATMDIGAFEVQSKTPFDFDGDGRADISVFRPSSGVWYLQQSTNGFTGLQFGLSTDKLAPADYDGDGKTDIAVYRDGLWYLLRSQSGFTTFQFGLAEDIPQPADFEGDGRTELAVYRPSNGTWYVFNLLNNQFSAVQFGILTDKPVVGDYDGDSRADYAVYRPSEGVWYLLGSSFGFTATQFGLATDVPTPGDYDGDGRTDLAVYRSSEGVWYLLRSRQGFTTLQWGISTDIPAPADYDGDGRTDLAVYRDRVWYLLQSTNGVSIQQFGLPNDKPVPAAYLP